MDLRAPVFVWKGYAVKTIEVGREYERFIGMGKDKVLVKALTMDDRSVRVDFDADGVYYLSLNVVEGWVPLS